MTARFTVLPLAPTHRRKHFACGVPALDRYLQDLAMQDMKRRISNCFGACETEGTISAYDSFAATSLPLTDLPPDLTKRLPRYGVIPAALLGRRGDDERFRRQGLGSALVIDAVRRAARADPANFALVVDVKDDQAMGFYQHLEFHRFANRPLPLSLPIATDLRAIETED